MNGLPGSWCSAPLEALTERDASIVYGIIQAGPEVPGGVPYVRPTELVDGGIALTSLKRTSVDIAKHYERASLRAGDIILAIVGTIGKLAVVPPELEGANITQSSARVRPGPAVAPGYLPLALTSPQLRAQFDLAEFGIAVRRLNIAHVRALEIPLPPLAEQRRIVVKLEDLLARSRRAKEALDAIPPLLEKLRRSVLAAAFRGDLTADWREKNSDAEPAENLLARIRVERRRRWEEAELAKMTARGRAPADDRWKEKYVEPEPVDASTLPDLPDGWCWTTTETVGHLLLGRRRAQSEYVEGEAGRVLQPYLRVANVKEDRLDFSDVLTMPFSPEELELYTLQPGDIVLSEGQSPELVGQSAVYDGGHENLCIQATVHRFRPYVGGVSTAYAQLAFLNNRHQGVFKRASSLTTNIAHLTSERLKPLPFPLAPAKEQPVLVERARHALLGVQATRETCDVARREVARGERAILAKAFRGELVPQDPNDEPAAVMLARLKAEAEREGEKPKKRGRAS